jgi:hypothetical protein
MFRLTTLELGLLAAFLFCALAVAAIVAWLAARRLRERRLRRRAVAAMAQEDYAAALRLLVAAQRCWLPATLHPTAGNCQYSLEEYAAILSDLGEAARKLGEPLETAPMEELVRRRIATINLELFQDVPHKEIQDIEEAFGQQRRVLDRTCEEILARVANPPATEPQ